MVSGSPGQRKHLTFFLGASFTLLGCDLQDQVLQLRSSSWQLHLGFKVWRELNIRWAGFRWARGCWLGHQSVRICKLWLSNSIWWSLVSLEPSPWYWLRIILLFLVLISVFLQFLSRASQEEDCFLLWNYISRGMLKVSPYGAASREESVWRGFIVRLVDNIAALWKMVDWGLSLKFLKLRRESAALIAITLLQV